MIKIYEDFKKTYSLIGYPNDDEIITISQKEFDLINMVTNFLILWKVLKQSWTYQDKEKNELKDWLEAYRETGDTELATDIKKYNL